MRASRLLSLALAVALAATGLVNPLMAAAQSQSDAPAPAAAPPVQTPPAPAPAPPDLYQEALKATEQTARPHEAAYQAGAVVASAFSVPGRVVTCAIGSALTIVTLVVTLGSQPGAAKSVLEEGCGGQWIVTPADLRAANARSGMGASGYAR